MKMTQRKCDSMGLPRLDRKTRRELEKEAKRSAKKKGK